MVYRMGYTGMKVRMRPVAGGYQRVGKPYIASKKVRRSYLKKRTKNPFVQKVQAIINRNLETKYVRETIASEPATTLWNSVISGSADWYRCLPLVARGGQSHQRIGDHIDPTSLTMNWSFRLATEDENTRDIFVVLYVLQSKSVKDYLTNNAGGALSANFNQYLDNGNDTTTYFAGTWVDAQKPINRENFTLIHKKVIPLLKGSGVPNGSGVVPSARGMYTHERSVRGSCSYTIKNLPKFLYSDVSLARPSNYAPVWAVGYYYGDGTAADTTTGILDVAMDAHLYFKDG